MTEQESIDRIEEDRRKRERELLLAFLILFGTATHHATMAIRLGHDPGIAAQNVINGNAQLGLPGLSPSLAKLMALTHSDGYRRADLLAGIRPTLPRDEIPPDVLPRYYAAARRMSSAMADTLTDKINEAIGEAPADANARGVATFVRNAIASDGYGKDHPYLLETVAERVVVDAHGAGMWDRSVTNQDIWGFKFIAVLDSGTTTICRTCDQTTLPKDHPWLRTHCPSCHFGCRSLLCPIKFGSSLAVATDNPPSIECAPGFGFAPLSFGLWAA